MCPTYIEIQFYLMCLFSTKKQKSELCPMCPTLTEIQFILICLLLQNATELVVSHVSHLYRNTALLDLPPYYKTQQSELCPMSPTLIEIQFYLICLFTTKRNIMSCVPCVPPR
jgi:hypothetical protein